MSAARNSFATWLAIKPLTPVTSTKELGATAEASVFSLLPIIKVGGVIFGRYLGVPLKVTCVADNTE